MPPPLPKPLLGIAAHLMPIPPPPRPIIAPRGDGGPLSLTAKLAASDHEQCANAPSKDAYSKISKDSPELLPDEHLETGALQSNAIYHGHARIIDYAVRARAGMQAKLGLPDDSHQHPFKSLLTGGAGSGQRIRLILADPDMFEEQDPLYVGEAILAWWAEDCKIGRSVTLRLDDGPDGARRHPLEGRQPGESIYIACWAIQEDETIASPDAIKKGRRSFNNMGAAQQSQIKCRLDPAFQAWTRKFTLRHLDTAQQEHLPRYEDNPSEFAAEVVRRWCGIRSRAEFSESNEEAERARFRWQEMLALFESRPRD